MASAGSTLRAVPAIQKRVGFAEIERLELNSGTKWAKPTGEFPDAPSAGPTEPRRELSLHPIEPSHLTPVLR